MGVTEPVGLFGGAFDPPHLGHVELVRAAKQRFDLRRLVVLVAAAPGHKAVPTPGAIRLELARAAFPDEDVRLDEHARTVDLLRESEWDDPIFLIGADQFLSFCTWKEPDEVLRRARLGVATRPGYPHGRLDAELAELEQPERVTFFQIRPLAVSSTELRRLAAAGDSLVDQVPPAVAALIRERGLYRP